MPAERRDALAALGLTLAAIALAGAAQSRITSRPWLSLAGFALAMALAILGRRRPARIPVRAPSPHRRKWPRSFWLLFGAATLACAGAGWAVYRGAAVRTSHFTWLAGLLLYAASAVRLWRSGGGALRRPRWKVGAAMTVLVLVCLALYGWRLSTIPPEVHGDEAEVGLDALRLLEGPFNLFATGWFRLPRFHAVPTAIGLKLFGADLFGLRATSAALGIGTTLLLFAVAYRLWSFEIAALAALLLASQRFFIHLSRSGHHYIDTPFLSVLLLWLFLRVWQDGRLGAAVWCGIALGLGVQTYYASRLVPVLLGLTFLCWLIGSDRTQRRGRILAFDVIVVTALATAAPMAAYFTHDWNALWERTRDTSVFGAEARQHLAYGYHTNNLAAILLIQARAAFALFNAIGDNSLQYGYGEALFEPISAALFVLGIALVVAGVRQRRNQLLLIWTVVPLIVGSVLTIDTPFYPRISGLVPFAVLAVAVALGRGLAALREAWPGTGGRRLAGTAAAAVLAAVFANNIRTYFIDYAPHHYHSPAVPIARWILAHGRGRTTHMVGGAPDFYIRHGTIRFMTHGYDTHDIIDLDRSLRTQRFNPATSAWIIMPQGKHLIPRLTAALGPLTIEEHRDAHGALVFYSGLPQLR